MTHLPSLSEDTFCLLASGVEFADVYTNVSTALITLIIIKPLHEKVKCYTNVKHNSALI